MQRTAAKVLALVLAVLLFAPHGAEGMVLCVRADGHVSLEIGCGPGACAQEAGQSAAELLRRHHDVAPDEHPCCLDIPLPSAAEAPEAVAAPAPDGAVQLCSLSSQIAVVRDLCAAITTPAASLRHTNGPPVDASCPVLLI